MAGRSTLAFPTGFPDYEIQNRSASLLPGKYFLRESKVRLRIIFSGMIGCVFQIHYRPGLRSNASRACSAVPTFCVIFIRVYCMGVGYA